MFGFLNKKTAKSKKRFDRKVLRKNDISLLIVDERWNNLFASGEKSPEIVACEEKLKELLKEQARLNAEVKEISAHKKICMEKIMQLTPLVFDQNDENAKEQMHACEKDIKKINDRLAEIEKELDEMPDAIKEANLELLENTVNAVYFKIRQEELRVGELNRLIEEAEARLKEYMEEKSFLSKDYSDIYSYFHDLLGPEELEKMDKEFFTEGREDQP